MPVRNFLSVTFDDLNAFAFVKSLFPGVVQTPNIDRVMAMGTTFENAYAQVAVCNASRTSALTGLNPGLTGVHNNHDLWSDHASPAATLPGLLHAAGFDTSIVGKVFHVPSATPEIAAALASFEHAASPNGLYEITSEGHTLAWGESAYPGEQPMDEITADVAIERLALAGDDPFAMFVGLVRPHLNWVVPQEYLDLYPIDEIELPFTLDGDMADIPAFMVNAGVTHQEMIDSGEWREAVQYYLASITYADAQLGRVLDALEANGQLDDTMILLWTDHGYHLGDKDLWAKFTLWDEAARAPFVLALPGAADDGQVAGQVVELVDMMPTVLDLLGLDVPAGLSGRSLSAFIDDPSMIDDGAAITTMYGSAAIRVGDWRYIRYADGSTELYNIAADPNEWNNLTGDAGHAAIEAELDARLRTELETDGWRWVEAGETLSGGAIAETFVLEPGAGLVRGGDGDDAYFMPGGASRIVERADGGNDTVLVTGDYTLPNHVENAQAWSRGGFVPNFTGNGMDNMLAGARVSYGLGGDDYIVVAGGGSEAFGGNGDDVLVGVAGRDTLVGGVGNDLIVGGGNADTIEGGRGADILHGNGEDAPLDSAGDTLSYAGSATGVIISLETGMSLRGDARGDLFTDFEHLIGSGFADRLFGDDGVNWIDGGAGDDVIVAGAERDKLTGGDGVDQFHFRDGDTGATRQTAEIITDFTAGDRINLRLVDADVTVTGDQRFAWIGDGAFTGAAGELRFVDVGANTFIEGDTDGDGVADLMIRLFGPVALDAGDFVL